VYQTLQFPVPHIEIVLGQRNRRLRSNFSGNEQIVKPDQDADMVRDHVDEIEPNAYLPRTVVCRKSPRSQVDESGDRKPKTDSQRSSFGTQSKISREKKDGE
jgi:hypothetical protein